MSETKRKKKHFLVIGLRNGHVLEVPMESRARANDHADTLLNSAVYTTDAVHYEVIHHKGIKTWVDVCQIDFTTYRSEDLAHS